ncbi:unnamed protein product [Parnassius mnemosyne]|uniref:RNA-directed DNA polymerase n=1 Tax=Parnassius mnemosyne TaxID=213953 RepID=A0AAV1KW67_9NEOP
MPFGISSASEVFHKRLYAHFDDIEGVELFVDDLLIHGNSKNQHDFRLRQVLERCKQINVKLNKKKCKVRLTEINYLGHIITQNGIKPDDTHIQPILDMPKPQNTKDLERFLGLVTAWHWEEIHDKCFEDLKRCITNPLVLQFYSLDIPITISVDASKHGLEACLMQNGKPICFASKSLTKTKQAYVQIEMELYACVFACGKFYSYIYGRSDVTIETDHKPLISIIKKPFAAAPTRLQRMLIRLQPYTFKLVYKPGKYLYIADALSRAVAPSNDKWGDTRDELDARAQVCAFALANPLTDTHFVCLQKLTQSDHEMQELINLIRNGWPNSKKDVIDILKPYWDSREELTVAYKLVWKGQKIVIHKCMRREMLKIIHVGHLGAAKMKLRAREIMYWPNLNSQIEDMISHCQAYLTHRNENSKQPLIPHEVPHRAWSKVGIDIFHFNNKSYLLVVDYFSKFIEVEKLYNLTSECVINKLKIIFSRQGIPDMVMSDNGPEFTSRIFKEFCINWRFGHKTSSPRYPQSNGQAERAIQTVKQMLKKTQYDKSNFRLALLEFLNTPISKNLPSPAELLNNRKLRSIVPCPPEMLQPKLFNTQQAREILKSRQTVQKRYYDRGSKFLKPLSIGDKIKVHINGKWVDGIVIDILGERLYVLKLQSGRIIRRNRRHIIRDSYLRPENKTVTQAYDFDDVLATTPNAPTSPRPHTVPASSSAPPRSFNISTTATTAPYTTTTTNAYVTQSGRVVKVPDRWGYS